MATYKITAGSTQGLGDTENFIESLDLLLASLPNGWRNLFDSERELVVTRAPGRLDLMGGIADYSGSLVLQFPIRNAVHGALQRIEGKALRIASVPNRPGDLPRLFEMELNEFAQSRSPIEYASARARFARDPKDHWAAYVAGAFLVLMRERDFGFKEGAHVLIKSTVPEGKGVGSSAALEVAVMQAIATAYEIEIPQMEMALLCQKVENLVAGAPCGVMDQMTAVCGEDRSLLELLCQPAELKGMLALPKELAIWGLDSGIRHSVGGADYGTVRTAAFMGYRIVADIAGLQVHHGEHEGHVRIDDPKWKGYLANIAPEEFERDFAAHLPERIKGKDFLDRYNGITDRVTLVNPRVDYPVAAATRHPIHEHARVKSFAAILREWEGIEQAPLLGELMFKSHESYSECGLGCAATDQLVALVRDAGVDEFYGAKITGGGSGGTVAVLGRRGADAGVKAIAKRFYELTGHRPLIISGSSPGAGVFGNLRLTV
jgi:L-arabinokinase